MLLAAENEEADSSPSCRATIIWHFSFGEQLRTDGLMD